jgi:hypothetical protein
MNQRTMFLVAAGITAFVLVLAGGFAAYITHPAASTAAVASATSSAPQLTTTDAGQSVAEQSAAAESVAAYQQQLQEARAQLEEANRRLSKAYSEQPTQVPAQASAQATPVVQSVNAIITPDQAAFIGIAAAPGARLLRAPELVNFQGTRAYEMQFDGGAVYIDAISGGELSNTVAQPVFTSAFPQAADDEDNGGQQEDGGNGEAHEYSNEDGD